MSDKRSKVQAVFGQYAQNYVVSPTHASGYSLGRLVELLGIQANWRVLDLATGGGHTALRCASAHAQVIASDLTLPMLQAARKFHQNSTESSLQYVQHDAEALPFSDAVFDAVTCRIAPHHFPNPETFVKEAARVLKPEGWLGVVDIISPENDRAARYCNLFETLRDRSHQWAYSLEEWEYFFQQANLKVSHDERIGVKQDLGVWARRLGCSEATIQRLRAMLLQAPQSIREWYQVTAEPGWPPSAEIQFSIQQAIMVGQKNT